MQSGRPAASGGFVALLVEPVAVELVLVPLMLLVLLPLVLGVSLRTCLVTASQHFPAVVVVVVRGEVVVVVDVWATATPTLPASMAAAISPIPVIRMRRILHGCGLCPGDCRRDVGGTGPHDGRSSASRDKKRSRPDCAERGKQPYAIVSADGLPLAMAGLWERWKDRTSGDTVQTFTIITTVPNDLCGAIRDRMPAILPREKWATWRGEREADADELPWMILRPYPADRMHAYPVDVRVGNVRNNDPALLDPLVLSA